MNKKILTLICAGLMVAACVTSCTNKVNKNDEKDTETVETALENPRFSMMEREYPLSLKDKEEDGGKIYVSSNVRKPSVVAFDRVNSGVSKKINTVLKNSYDRNYESAGEVTDIAVEALKTEGFDISSAGFPWFLTSDYEIVRNDGLVISIKETIEYYAGGDISPLTSVFYYHFDTKTGEQIKQVMYNSPDNDDRDRVDNVVFEKLKEKYGEDAIDYSNVIASSIVEAGVDGWYFTDNGIVITFNEGEIAPIEDGKFEVELLKSELVDSANQYFLD